MYPTKSLDLTRIVGIVFLAMFLFLGFFAMSTIAAKPAFADNCSTVLCIGDGGMGAIEPGTSPGGAEEGGKSDPYDPPPAKPNPGQNKPKDPTAYSTSVNNSYSRELCGSNGPNNSTHRGATFYWRKVIVTIAGPIAVKPPWVPNSGGWKLIGVLPSGIQGHPLGHIWSSPELIGWDCKWSPQYIDRPDTCHVSFEVSLRKTAPNSKVVGGATRGTGYTPGSSNLSACRNSSANVSASVDVKEYGFYRTYTRQKYQRVVVRYYLTADGATGAKPADRIVGWDGVRTSAWYEGMNASLDCKNGWKNPGVSQPQYWTDANCMNLAGNFPQCTTPNPTINISENGRGSSKKSAKSTVQLDNDGVSRALTFNQRVTGSGVKVNSYSTKFTRSGSPWYNHLDKGKNLVELESSQNGATIMQTHNSSKKFSGNRDTIWVSGYSASGPGASMKVSQVLDWTGTRKMTSVRVTGFNPATGAIITKPISVNVPTSGACTQTASLQFLRSVGDSR